jgi:hypothetical protein
MNEDQLMAIIGRLYVSNTLRDNELKRLNGLVNEYEARARTHDDAQDDVKENPNDESSLGTA